MNTSNETLTPEPSDVVAMRQAARDRAVRLMTERTLIGMLETRPVLAGTILAAAGLKDPLSSGCFELVTADRLQLAAMLGVLFGTSDSDTLELQLVQLVDELIERLREIRWDLALKVDRDEAANMATDTEDRLRDGGDHDPLDVLRLERGVVFWRAIARGETDIAELICDAEEGLHRFLEERGADEEAP